MLVEVPGVGGVTTTEDRRLKTDFRGYSIVSGLSPYQEHDIVLETADLPPDAEVAKQIPRSCRPRGRLFVPVLARKSGQRR